MEFLEFIGTSLTQRDRGIGIVEDCWANVRTIPKIILDSIHGKLGGVGATRRVPASNAGNTSKERVLTARMGVGVGIVLFGQNGNGERVRGVPQGTVPTGGRGVTLPTAQGKGLQIHNADLGRRRILELNPTTATGGSRGEVPITRWLSLIGTGTSTTTTGLGMLRRVRGMMIPRRANDVGRMFFATQFVFGGDGLLAKCHSDLVKGRK